jgi:glycosyltransferase involved in cell wall biosynthesis
MRILQVANHCRRSGNGIVNVAVDLSCGLSSLKHRVAFASAGGEFVPLLAEHGIEHFHVDQTSRWPWSVILASIKFWRTVRIFRPDIVHVHMMTGAVIAKLFKPIFKYKLVSTVHNEFQRAAIVMGVADRVIAVSKAVSLRLQRRGISKEKIDVVCNGTIGTARMSAEIPDAGLVHPAVVCLAGLYHRKGIADLIDAFAIVIRHHPNAKLYIVGDGPQRAEFEEHAERSTAAAQITFVGFLPDARGYLKASDVFVLPSRDEPFGLVLTEARAEGCVIVATNVGGIPEALDDGIAGVLVPPNNPNVLGETIADLMSDKDRSAEMKARAKRGLDRFTTERVARETLFVYNQSFASPN